MSQAAKSRGQDRKARARLRVLRHHEQVTLNLSQTCWFVGISGSLFCPPWNRGDSRSRLAPATWHFRSVRPRTTSLAASLHQPPTGGIHSGHASLAQLTSVRLPQIRWYLPGLVSPRMAELIPRTRAIPRTARRTHPGPRRASNAHPSPSTHQATRRLGLAADVEMRHVQNIIVPEPSTDDTGFWLQVLRPAAGLGGLACRFACPSGPTRSASTNGCRLRARVLASEPG